MDLFTSYPDLALNLVKAAIGLPQNSQKYAQYGDTLFNMGRPGGFFDVHAALFQGDDGANQIFFPLYADISPDEVWLIDVNALPIEDDSIPVVIARFGIPDSELRADLTPEEIVKNFSLT